MLFINLLAIQKFFASSVLRLSALLITGEPGTGKTTYAAHLAMQSQVAHIKIITAQGTLFYILDSSF